MKRKILLSIDPVFVGKILDGTKRFEYRRKKAKKDVGKIVIYETRPSRKIVAEAEVLEVLASPPEELWTSTKDKSGTDKEFYDRYFKGCKTAFAYKLGKVTRYETPRSLADYGIKTAPQSFIYLN